MHTNNSQTLGSVWHTLNLISTLELILKLTYECGMRNFNPDDLPKLNNMGSPDDLKMPNTSHPHLYLEIGCGTGDHSLSFAHQNPDKYLLAIERTSNKFNRFLKKYQKFNLPNLSPIHSDAILWSSQFLTPESLEGCFILYPNPYPKKKQSNLRWHNMPYFQHLIKLLKPNAKLIFATNIESYAEEFIEVITTLYSNNLQVIQNSVIDPSNFTPRTAFEKKYLMRNEKCFNIILKKS